MRNSPNKKAVERCHVVKNHGKFDMVESDFRVNLDLSSLRRLL